MIDIDVARRLRDAGLRWDPRDGDLFAIDTELLRDDAFMLSSMVIEQGLGRHGERIFKFNGTTEWALDSIEQHEAIWIPREEQLREALGSAFRALELREDGHHVVRFRTGGTGTGASGAGGAGADETGAGGSGAPGIGEEQEVAAPAAEDAYAGALLVALTSA